jgi:hypothetical protein
MTAPERSSLPLRDYDHLPLSALAYRIRSLTAEEISQLLSYEREHANRLPVVQLLQTRLAELAAGAQPTGHRQQEGPEWPPPPSGRSPVSPATAAPPPHPPPHGGPREPLSVGTLELSTYHTRAPDRIDPQALMLEPGEGMILRLS